MTREIGGIARADIVSAVFLTRKRHGRIGADGDETADHPRQVHAQEG